MAGARVIDLQAYREARNKQRSTVEQSTDGSSFVMCCDHCGEEISPDEATIYDSETPFSIVMCKKCVEQFDVQPMICPSCGKTVHVLVDGPDGEKHCGYCFPF